MIEDLKFTPPPLFNVQTATSNRLSYTPASNGAWAGPPGTHNNTYRFTPASTKDGCGPHGNYDRHFNFTTANVASRFDFNHGPFKLTWWEPESFYYYDAMLISAFYGMKWWDYREYFNIPRENFILVADSGGFEQLTQKVRIDPIDVLRWEELNADVGFALDVPPKDPITHAPATDINHFISCAEQTQRNTDIMISHRENFKMKFYKVLQGGDKEQLDLWWTYIDKFETDGLCTSPQPAQQPLPTALHIGYALLKGIKNLHVLLGTGINVTPVNVYGSTLFDLYTFDSSSYGQGTMTRDYWLPNNLNESINLGRNGNLKYTNLPCDCPICQNVNADEMRADGSEPGALISLHNLYNYIRQVNFLKSLTQDPDYYFSYVKKHFPDNTYQALCFIRDCKEGNFDSAYKKYFRNKISLSSVWG